METLRALPVINSFLVSGNAKKAISILREYVEVLAPYITFDFPTPNLLNPEDCLVLCKLFLLRKDYPKAIAYGMKAKPLLNTLDPFYFDSLVFRMMEELVLRANESDPYTQEIREFIIEYIRDDQTSDALLGYLARIREFDTLKSKLVELSEGDIDCSEILIILHEIAPKEILEILVDCSIKNPTFFQHVIDALVTSKMDEKLKILISELSWEKMYNACFYLEDTHQYPLELENENANFILSGQWKQEILSNFLFKNNKTNFKFLESMSKARAPYIALVNSFMNAGTTNDSLYRNNKNLISGKDWNRFLELASLGMIHQGNYDPFEILKELLPSLESSSGEAGALMALGIMNAGRNDEEANEYYLNWLNSNSEDIVFGSCIGLGLNAMESGNKQLFERLKSLFSADNTITQESALYSAGLIFAGTEDKEVVDFIRSIHDNTDFPRVRRVAGLAIALIFCFGDNRTDLLNYLNSDDASIRSMGLLALGSAYAATANLDIIGKILPFIDDRDDETKRSAVIAISLIGYGDHEIKNSCIIPLAENHNTFVRATAALCLGFFNSGLCDIEVCCILEAMLYDTEDLVKQNACIGAGFALMQGNPTLIPNYKRTLDKMNMIIASRTESQCCKIGASIGRAISEASGKSSIFSLKNFSGQVLSSKVIGALMFLFSWYWFPLIPCVALCLHPTPIFFFDQNLDETDDTFVNSESNYDYLVRLPELKKSRKFKQSKTPDQTKDILEPAKMNLKSGDKLNYKERLIRDAGTGIIFKDKK